MILHGGVVLFSEGNQHHGEKFALSSLIPAGLVVEAIAENEGVIVITARSGTLARPCPLCRRVSSRVHSRYVRRVSDLPCSGTKVELRLVARRFVCDATLCRRRIFAERCDDSVVTERSRRTPRLECIVHHLGLALGGRPAASFAKRLMVPVSNGTLLRLCGDEPVYEQTLSRLSASTTGPIAVTIATARSSAIWSDGGS